MILIETFAPCRCYCYLRPLAASKAATTSGGSDTSLENNNVYAVEPQMYVQGADGEEIAVVDGVDSKSADKMDPGTLAISIAGVAALALVRAQGQEAVAAVRRRRVVCPARRTRSSV